MNTPKRKKFNSVLDTPIDIYSKNVSEDLKEREKELFKLYHLERPEFLTNSTRILIMQMANDLKIKGFKPAHLAKSPGKPQKWLGAEGWILYARVQLYIQKHPNTSLREAIDNIRRKHYKDYTLNTLYSRYCEIQKTQIPDAINLFIKTSINSPLLTCTTEKEVLSVITNLDT